MVQRMLDNHSMQVADRVFDGVAVAAGVMWLADIQTMAVAFSAASAGIYYLVRALVLWKDRKNQKPED